MRKKRCDVGWRRRRSTTTKTTEKRQVWEREVMTALFPPVLGSEDWAASEIKHMF